MPTGTSEAFPRDKGGLLTGLRRRHPAYRCLSGILAWQRGLLTVLWHGDLAHRHLRAIPVWRRGSSDRSSARGPCLQVPQWHSRVAKGSSGQSSARRPYPQVLQSHPRVAKGQPIGPRPATSRCSNWTFGTATLPTDASVASSCGERPADWAQTGNFTML